MKATRGDGLTLMEVMFGLGLMSFALIALLSVCSMGLRYNRQNISNLSAVQVADAELGRTLSSVLNDMPVGTSAAFWGAQFPYPTTPYRKGKRVVGHEEFIYATYAVTAAGLGTPPDNEVRKVDTYVWWTEPGSPGGKLTSCSRLVNKGEQP